MLWCLGHLLWPGQLSNKSSEPETLRLIEVLLLCWLQEELLHPEEERQRINNLCIVSVLSLLHSKIMHVRGLFSTEISDKLINPFFWLLSCWSQSTQLTYCRMNPGNRIMVSSPLYDIHALHTHTMGHFQSREPTKTFSESTNNRSTLLIPLGIINIFVSSNRLTV